MNSVLRENCAVGWGRTELAVMTRALCFAACQDCMEEISLFSDNKLQLTQLADQLIKASSKAKAAETEDKLSKVNDRWQHLFDVIGSR